MYLEDLVGKQICYVERIENGEGDLSGLTLYFTDGTEIEVRSFSGNYGFSWITVEENGND